MSIINFTCENCGNHGLEEIQVDVTQAAELLDLDEDGFLEYSEILSEGGVVDRYQCTSCGTSIMNADHLISDPTELWHWLNARGMVNESH